MSLVAQIPLNTGSGATSVADVHFVDAQQCKNMTRKLSTASQLGRPLDDAIEFVHLAAKRWNYYHKSGFAVSSHSQLKEAIRLNEHCEVGFMLMAVLPDETMVGGCFARRTWAGNLLLDFLFTHPSVFTMDGNVTRIGGVGVGIMSVLASLALANSGEELWGEATQNSHGFYQKLKSRLLSSPPPVADPISDRFIFRKAELEILRSKSVPRFPVERGET